MFCCCCANKKYGDDNIEQVALTTDNIVKFDKRYVGLNITVYHFTLFSRCESEN